MAEPSDGRWVGRARKRVEDRRLLTGIGRYVDDLHPPGLCHVVFLRSPHAHARLSRVDVAAAARAPGVLAVVTGDDVRHLGPPPVMRLFPDMRVPPQPILAVEVVRAVGVPVVAVAAESAAEAHDALGLVEVAYEPLPPVIDAEAALAPG